MALGDKVWGTDPVKDVSLTKHQFQELCTAIVQIGTDRKKRQGGKIDEADFFTGAMAVMERLGIQVPAWPLLIMAGRNIIPDEEEISDEEE